uniref:Uncharacterized protein n=1 Tax=Terrapene triunguis TaxID=2587831 RepID=A0A674K6Y2_9SAUR
MYIKWWHSCPIRTDQLSYIFGALNCKDSPLISASTCSLPTHNIPSLLLTALRSRPWCLKHFTLYPYYFPFLPPGRDHIVLGDTNGAGSYGKTAKCLNITVLVLSLLTVVLIIVLVATGVVAISDAIQQENQNRNNYRFNYGS